MKIYNNEHWQPVSSILSNDGSKFKFQYLSLKIKFVKNIKKIYPNFQLKL